MKRLLAIGILATIMSCAQTYAQGGAFMNLHASALGKIDTKSPLTRDEFGNMNADTAIINNGFGGGLTVGYRFNAQWTILMNLDIIAQKGTTNSLPDVDASTFVFDLGVRYGLTSSTVTQPYLLANIGYYGLSFHYGDPTIYIGPGGGGYSSGTDEYDGWHVSGGLGLQVNRMFDIHVVGSWASVADFESKFAVRVNAGFSIWFFDEASTE